LNPFDAFDAGRWSMAADPNSRDAKGAPPHPVTPARIDKPVFGLSYYLDVVTDREMSSFPAVYTITMKDLRGVDGTMLAEQTVAFAATYRIETSPEPQYVFANRDIANPQIASALLGLPQGFTSQAEQLGTFRSDATGDVAYDEGLASYKKRVYRRLTTKRGGFAHLRNYGVGLPDSIKQLARAGKRAQLAADAEEQIRQEPETANVSVTVAASDQAIGLFVYIVKVKMRTGQQITFSFGVPQGTSAEATGA
jgi:hypothetical protein